MNSRPLRQFALRALLALLWPSLWSFILLSSLSLGRSSLWPVSFRRVRAFQLCHLPQKRTALLVYPSCMYLGNPHHLHSSRIYIMVSGITSSVRLLRPSYTSSLYTAFQNLKQGSPYDYRSMQEGLNSHHFPNSHLLPNDL